MATLYQLGITPSNSRPRVSNDNPYAESLFKTLKYRPNYQPKGFGILVRLDCGAQISLTGIVMSIITVELNFLHLLNATTVKVKQF